MGSFGAVLTQKLPLPDCTLPLGECFPQRLIFLPLQRFVCSSRRAVCSLLDKAFEGAIVTELKVIWGGPQFKVIWLWRPASQAAAVD